MEEILFQPGELTGLLHAWKTGDEHAYGELFEKSYTYLKRLAARILLPRNGPSFQPTELVHEAFLDLRRAGSVDWADREHFFAVASRALREVVADRIARKATLKRGGDRIRVPLEDHYGSLTSEVSLFSLHQVLEQLRTKDARLYHIVELRFFGGLSIASTARVLGLSRRTVSYDWELARVWLYRRLK